MTHFHLMRTKKHKILSNFLGGHSASYKVFFVVKNSRTLFLQMFSPFQAIWNTFHFLTFVANKCTHIPPLFKQCLQMFCMHAYIEFEFPVLASIGTFPGCLKRLCGGGGWVAEIRNKLGLSWAKLSSSLPIYARWANCFHLDCLPLSMQS